MSKHSPGPWKWGYDKLVDGDGKTILQNNTEYLPHDVSEDDERLIAAAPEMLELLREINQSNIAGSIEITDEDVPRRLTALLARIDGQGQV